VAFALPLLTPRPFHYSFKELDITHDHATVYCYAHLLVMRSAPWNTVGLPYKYWCDSA